MDPVRTGSYYVNKISKTTNDYNYVVFANSTAQESSTYYINQMDKALLRYATGNPAANIQMTIYPFVFT